MRFMAILEARNEQEELKGDRIQEFAKIYRRYKILNQKTVGNYFFKEMEDLVNKLCNDFEVTVRSA